MYYWIIYHIEEGNKYILNRTEHIKNLKTQLTTNVELLQIIYILYTFSIHQVFIYLLLYGKVK